MNIKLAIRKFCQSRIIDLTSIASVILFAFVCVNNAPATSFEFIFATALMIISDLMFMYGTYTLKQEHDEIKEKVDKLHRNI